MTRTGTITFSATLFLCVLATAPATPEADSRRDTSSSSGKETPRTAPGGFGGRFSPRREQLLKDEGGTEESEKAVARGLRWLALHQAAAGHWSLDKFNLCARPDLKSTRYFDDRSSGAGLKNDVAGTAFGLLPFLAAGITHKATKDKEKAVYTRTVARGLNALLRQQGRGGVFSNHIYAHTLATIALCEAYGMTADPTLKRPAQAALNYLIAYQDPVGGGWRYQPRKGSDTSVTGFALMALKSGQLAGLNVPAATFKAAARWLDACASKDKDGYGYTNNVPSPPMTAVGLLCRLYLGTPPNDPRLRNGIKTLRGFPPGKLNNLYYEYYAAQVMHHVGAADWKFWNEGPKSQKDGIRDVLMARQGQDGSWSPQQDESGRAGGRIMQTSWSLLTLQIYYRHLPLFKRDTAEK